MEKLKSLSEFVTEVEEYANESRNYQRAWALIFEYNEWLKQDIHEDMFLGENPLFVGFAHCTMSIAVELGKEKAYCRFGKNEWQISILRMSGEEYGLKDEMKFVTSFHLKTINDLVGKIEFYNNSNEQFGHSNFNE